MNKSYLFLIPIALVVGLFVAAMVLSLYLIISGWKATVPEFLYIPPAWGRHAASLLVLIAFVQWPWAVLTGVILTGMGKDGAQGMAALGRLGCNVFLEIGPNPTLIGTYKTKATADYVGAAGK